MTPYYADSWLTILGGDCREVLATVPAGSVHACVTSPPYFGLRDYGVTGQLGAEASLGDYVSAMVDVFRAVRRTLAPSATLWLNLGDSYAADSPGFKPKDLMGVPWAVANALRDDGWWLRSAVVWDKPNAMPGSVEDRPIASHEYVFLLSPSETYYYDWWAVREAARPGSTSDRRMLRDVWRISTRPYAGSHVAPFPPKLVEPCILAGTSARGVCHRCGAPCIRRFSMEHRPNVNRGTVKQREVHRTGNFEADRRDRRFVDWAMSCAHADGVTPALVLDPFAGSGTVGEVARKHGRRALLIDLNPEYVGQALIRATGAS